MGRSPGSNIFKSSGPEDTARFAGLTAGLLKGGELLLLDGPIGSGKTFFTRELARAMGAKRLPVSASFNLMRAYPGRLKIFHFDLFRAAGADMENIGLEEYLGRRDGVTVVEWGEPAAGLTRALPSVRLFFALAGGDARLIRAAAEGPAGAVMISELERKWRKN